MDAFLELPGKITREKITTIQFFRSGEYSACDLAHLENSRREHSKSAQLGSKHSFGVPLPLVHYEVDESKMTVHTFSFVPSVHRVL